MMAHGRRLFSDDVNPADVGRQFHAKQLAGVTDAMIARRDLPGESFIDVHYADLMADPMKEVRRIYDFLGYDLLPETIEAMNAFRGPRTRRTSAACTAMGPKTSVSPASSSIATSPRIASTTGSNGSPDR